MREHLYKAKLIDGGKWVQGYLYRFWDHAYIFCGEVLVTVIVIPASLKKDLKSMLR